MARGSDTSRRTGSCAAAVTQCAHGCTAFFPISGENLAFFLAYFPHTGHIEIPRQSSRPFPRTALPAQTPLRIPFTVPESAMAAYSASKAGIEALTRTMALDHAREGIRVNCVVPGSTDTPIS